MRKAKIDAWDFERPARVITRSRQRNEDAAEEQEKRDQEMSGTGDEESEPDGDQSLSQGG